MGLLLANLVYCQYRAVFEWEQHSVKGFGRFAREKETQERLVEFKWCEAPGSSSKREEGWPTTILLTVQINCAVAEAKKDDQCALLAPLIGLKSADRTDLDKPGGRRQTGPISRTSGRSCKPS